MPDIPPAAIAAAESAIRDAFPGEFGKPVDDYTVHLVRHTKGGTPGPTLCNLDRFHPKSAGWSVGGGLSGPGIIHKPCPGCTEAARTYFPGLEVTGLGAREMAEALGVPWSHWNGGRFTDGT